MLICFHVCITILYRTIITAIKLRKGRHMQFCILLFSHIYTLFIIIIYLYILLIGEGLKFISSFFLYCGLADVAKNLRLNLKSYTYVLVTINKNNSVIKIGKINKIKSNNRPIMSYSVIIAYRLIIYY